MKFISHDRKPLQLPDLFDWDACRDIYVAEHRVRWVTHRCRVSPSIADVIADLAGLGPRGAPR
jgi:hypothetical protein